MLPGWELKVHSTKYDEVLTAQYAGASYKCVVRWSKNYRHSYVLAEQFQQLVTMMREAEKQIYAEARRQADTTYQEMGP